MPLAYFQKETALHPHRVSGGGLSTMKTLFGDYGRVEDLTTRNSIVETTEFFTGGTDIVDGGAGNDFIFGGPVAFPLFLITLLYLERNTPLANRRRSSPWTPHAYMLVAFVGGLFYFYNTVDIISDFEFKTTDDGGKKTAEALREVSLPGPPGCQNLRSDVHNFLQPYSSKRELHFLEA
mgnify:CR=1 FL=1